MPLFRVGLLAGLLAAAGPTSSQADPMRLSQMPDPRGEFIRLCAPYMVARHAHPESVCDCLRTALRGEVGDQQVFDAILYGVTESGVPTLEERWLPPEKRPLIDRTLSAIAEPTMECLFGSGHARKAPPAMPLDGFPAMMPTQDFAP